jgi:hypothetical protein
MRFRQVLGGRPFDLDAGLLPWFCCGFEVENRALFFVEKIAMDDPSDNIGDSITGIFELADVFFQPKSFIVRQLASACIGRQVFGKAQGDLVLPVLSKISPKSMEIIKFDTIRKGRCAVDIAISPSLARGVEMLKG